MEIEQATEEDKTVKLVFVEAVLMPNGEIIRNGKTIQRLKESEKLEGIYKAKENKI